MYNTFRKNNPLIHRFLFELSFILSVKRDKNIFECLKQGNSCGKIKFLLFSQEIYQSVKEYRKHIVLNLFFWNKDRDVFLRCMDQICQFLVNFLTLKKIVLFVLWRIIIFDFIFVWFLTFIIFANKVFDIIINVFKS